MRCPQGSRHDAPSLLVTPRTFWLAAASLVVVTGACTDADSSTSSEAPVASDTGESSDATERTDASSSDTSGSDELGNDDGSQAGRVAAVVEAGLADLGLIVDSECVAAVLEPLSPQDADAILSAGPDGQFALSVEGQETYASTSRCFDRDAFLQYVAEPDSVIRSGYDADCLASELEDIDDVPGLLTVDRDRFVELAMPCELAS